MHIKGVVEREWQRCGLRTMTPSNHFGLVKIIMFFIKHKIKVCAVLVFDGVLGHHPLAGLMDNWKPLQVESLTRVHPLSKRLEVDRFCDL